MGKQKEFPTTTRKGTQADGPTTLGSRCGQGQSDAHVSETRLSDRVDHWTASLAISFDCDHTRPDPAPWPATTTTTTLSAAVVSCCFLLAVAVPLQLIHTTTSFSLLFCSRPSALSLLRQLELRGASFASTRDVTFGFFFQSACLVLHYSTATRPYYCIKACYTPRHRHINLTPLLPAWITKYNGIRYHPNNTKPRRVHSYERSQGIRL